jgi:hypothetical protein
LELVQREPKLPEFSWYGIGGMIAQEKNVAGRARHDFDRGAVWFRHWLIGHEPQHSDVAPLLP